MGEKTERAKSYRIYSTEDVELHNKSGDCWVSYKGSVLDVSGFLQDHPGGDDLILNHAGKDVTAIMADPDEHTHSDAAYGMLHEFKIGQIGVEADIVKEGSCFCVLILFWLPRLTLIPRLGANG